jgi:diguanylate cyclase (GGDEF)-like protein
MWKTWVNRLAQPVTDDERKELDALHESHSVMKALLGASTRLMSGASFDDVILRVCESVVGATHHIRLAWFWHGPPDPPVIRPLVSAGPARSYAENLVINRNLLTRLGPAYQALLSNQSEVTRVFQSSPYGPWRRASRQFGFEVTIAIPVRTPDPGSRGILVFYADDRNYFGTVGVEPFEAFAHLSEVALAQVDSRAKLAHFASTDLLTGQFNRRAMSDLMAKMAQRSFDGPAAVESVVMIDIDRFKTINDTYGHDAGDRVLAQVAHCIKLSLRDHDVLSRWGGEEFLAVLPGADREAAMMISERLRSNIAAMRIEVENGEVSVTCSVGVASSSNGQSSLRALLRMADAALYDAKQLGRNLVRHAAA